jgi:hypothetical protein
MRFAPERYDGANELKNYNTFDKAQAVKCGTIATQRKKVIISNYTGDCVSQGMPIHKRFILKRCLINFTKAKFRRFYCWFAVVCVEFKLKYELKIKKPKFLCLLR